MDLNHHDHGGVYVATNMLGILVGLFVGLFANVAGRISMGIFGASSLVGEGLFLTLVGVMGSMLLYNAGLRKFHQQTLASFGAIAVMMFIKGAMPYDHQIVNFTWTACSSVIYPTLLGFSIFLTCAKKKNELKSFSQRAGKACCRRILITLYH